MPSNVNQASEDELLTLQQEARGKLRESFLRAVSLFNGEPCKIMTYELSSLEATFSVWKPDGEVILVTDLQTPAAVKMPSALLRAPDVISIQFKKPIQLP